MLRNICEMCDACAQIGVNILRVYIFYIVVHIYTSTEIVATVCIERSNEGNSCIVKEGGSRETIGSRPSSNATAHTVGNSSALYEKNNPLYMYIYILYM